MKIDWLSRLALEIGRPNGDSAQAGLLQGLEDVADDDHDAICVWFHSLIEKADALDDRPLAASLFADHCPCISPEIEDNVGKNFRDAADLPDFVARLNDDGLFSDVIRLEGNVLIATKQPWERYGMHDHDGCFSKACHCWLASHARAPISDLFCHCCTVGYYGKMFKSALGVDIRVELIESVISGGKGCTAAIYLPEKGDVAT